MSIRWSLAVVGVAVAISVQARADVVPPVAENCPTGAKGSASHSGPYCRPDLCDTGYESDRCNASERCQAEQLCIVSRKAGGLQMPGAEPYMISHVVSACDASGRCTEGSCKTLRVCMPNTSKATGGSGADVGGGDTLGSSDGAAAAGGPAGPGTDDKDLDNGEDSSRGRAITGSGGLSLWLVGAAAAALALALALRWWRNRRRTAAGR